MCTQRKDSLGSLIGLEGQLGETSQLTNGRVGGLGEGEVQLDNLGTSHATIVEDCRSDGSDFIVKIILTTGNDGARGWTRGGG